MDYTARYGLEFNPFLKNSKEVLVETQEYKEVLFRLDYLLTTKGFGLLTGSAGRGKTTAVRNWASGLNTSLYKVMYSSLSTLTVNDFYRNLATELGAQPAFRKTDNFKSIQDEINRLVLEKRQTPVIIIDEANYIGNAVLNDLKMLFNFEMDSKDRAVVLLSGLPQLNSTLRLSIHEPFRQRIVMNYNLEGMTKAEGHSYVAAKLNGAGCTQTVFEENALEAILNAANGTPRMINKLCNASGAWRMPLLHRDFSLAFTLDFLGLYHSRYGFWQVHFRHLILHMRLALYLCNTASRILYFNSISCWNSAISLLSSSFWNYRNFYQTYRTLCLISSDCSFTWISK